VRRLREEGRKERKESEGDREREEKRETYTELCQARANKIESP
jgi:hypothetical protein